MTDPHETVVVRKVRRLVSISEEGGKTRPITAHQISQTTGTAETCQPSAKLRAELPKKDQSVIVLDSPTETQKKA
jgi:hypothetical protein